MNPIITVITAYYFSISANILAGILQGYFCLSFLSIESKKSRKLTYTNFQTFTVFGRDTDVQICLNVYNFMENEFVCIGQEEIEIYACSVQNSRNTTSQFGNEINVRV